MKKKEKRTSQNLNLFLRRSLTAKAVITGFLVSLYGGIKFDYYKMSVIRVND